MDIPKNFVDEPFAYHEELTLEISTLTNLGIGLGRLNNWVVMVPFALPGEKVRVSVFRNHSNYSEADLLEVLEASPHRIDPVCPIFGECGGCQYQNYAYSEQLKWKRKQVEEIFDRVGGLSVEVQETHPSPKQYGYRSKITPHFQKPPKDGSAFDIGFQRFHNRRIIDVPQCAIATDNINASLPKERERILSRERKFKKGGTLLLRDSMEGVTTDMKAVVTEKLGKLIFQFQAGEFFQNNPFVLPELVSYAVEEARAGDNQFLIDAYCGVGVFCLSAASWFERCVGIEISAKSVHWAIANAAINQLQNCSFQLGTAEEIFKGVDFEAASTSLIIDPPRKGCDREFLDQLFAFGPSRVVYVSCAPDTQARDLRHFMDKGYEITRVQPFDLFPHTRHIENVVSLSR